MAGLPTSRVSQAFETRLADLVCRLHRSKGVRYSVHELEQLAMAIVKAGDSFYVRRVLQMFERNEIGFAKTLYRLRSGSPRLPHS